MYKLVSLSCVLLLLLGGCTTTFKNLHIIPVTIDYQEVLWFAERANAAYDEPATIKEKFKNVIHVYDDPYKQIRFFVEEHADKKLQLISVRGTDNLANVKQDAEIIQIKDKNIGIYVHKGFDSDAQDILKEVRPLLKKNYAIKVTGHSLGAAIATILMIYLHNEGFDIQHSMNFGQPKFTTLAGAAKYNFLPLTRFVNREDVVPLVPPNIVVDDEHGIYVHFRPEVILLNQEYFVYLDQHDATQTVTSSFWDNLGHESLEDHRMVNYIKHIKNKLKQQKQEIEGVHTGGGPSCTNQAQGRKTELPEHQHPVEEDVHAHTAHHDRRHRP